jgi:hypothetical protein
MNDVSTKQILDDEAILQLLSGTVPQQISEKNNPLGTVECFLQLFIDREEYEICQRLVEVHPELLHINC